ncbi:hypothetical protein LINPERHAP2_LOCUS38702, partial [Linum perenne]
MMDKKNSMKLAFFLALLAISTINTVSGDGVERRIDPCTDCESPCCCVEVTCVCPCTRAKNSGLLDADHIGTQA